MPKRGESATPAQRAALKRGQERRAEALSKPNVTGETQTTRWRKLLSGTLTVADLTDAEISRMRVHGKNGVFAGPAPRLPSHLAQAFHSEAIKRAQGRIRTATPEVTKALLDIAKDPEVKDSDRIKVLMYLMDRQLGKTPETIRVEGESPWDRALNDAIGAVDRDLADAAREVLNPDVDS